VTAGWDDIEEQELDPAALERLTEIRVPTLVLVGSIDLDLVREAARRGVDGIAGARLVNWPDTAHLPSMERPDDYLLLLSGCGLRRTPQSRCLVCCPMMDETSRTGGSAVRRVWSRLPPGAQSVLENGLSPTDLQSLLLDLARTRAHRTTPASVRRRWQQDRFVQPSPVDPRRLAEVNLHLWRLLPPEFEGLALSPVTPLGTCTAVDATDQNRVLSTVRSSELVSDQTNVLALEAARQRLAGRPETHLAASHRVLRHQQYSHRDARPHFELFALVSSARDTGSARTEAELLVKHLRFWGEAVPSLVDDEVVVELTIIDRALGERIRDTVQPQLPALHLRDAPRHTKGIGYYRSGRFKIILCADGHESELGDGGFTAWTAALTADAKERCLISCVSSERLAQLAKDDHPA
jgi:hypothetical protein